MTMNMQHCVAILVHINEAIPSLISQGSFLSVTIVCQRSGLNYLQIASASIAPRPLKAPIKGASQATSGDTIQYLISSRCSIKSQCLEICGVGFPLRKRYVRKKLPAAVLWGHGKFPIKFGIPALKSLAEWRHGKIVGDTTTCEPSGNQPCLGDSRNRRGVRYRIPRTSRWGGQLYRGQQNENTPERTRRMPIKQWPNGGAGRASRGTMFIIIYYWAKQIVFHARLQCVAKLRRVGN